MTHKSILAFCVLNSYLFKTLVEASQLHSVSGRFSLWVSQVMCFWQLFKILPSPWQNLWICLICGHIGCGRYVSRHAYKHFEETQHTYAMQLTNHRVWDYAGGEGHSRFLIWIHSAGMRLPRNLSPSSHSSKSPCRQWQTLNSQGAPEGTVSYKWPELHIIKRVNTSILALWLFLKFRWVGLLGQKYCKAYNLDCKNKHSGKVESVCRLFSF